MPATAINATPGSATANAYVTLAVANQYMLNRPSAGIVWSSASDDSKTAGILWSTLLLDSLWEWYGYPTDPDVQALLWPRSGLYSFNRVSALDALSIPLHLQYACAEFARQLMTENRTEDSAIESLGIKLLKVDTIRLDFKDGVYAKPVPDIVRNLIPYDWGYVRSSAAGSGLWERPIVRT